MNTFLTRFWTTVSITSKFNVCNKKKKKKKKEKNEYKNLIVILLLWTSQKKCEIFFWLWTGSHFNDNGAVS